MIETDDIFYKFFYLIIKKLICFFNLNFYFYNNYLKIQKIHNFINLKS